MKKNKTKKALASLAIVGMAMTMTPFNALADTGVTTARISGSDRIETAVKVADTFKTATTAIVAPSADANLVDALAAAPLAGKTTPILLTDNNNLSDSTKAELVKLGVKNVYVVGAINKTVVDQLNAMTGVTATALKGADRIATAAAVAGKLTNPAGSFVVGYGALADALSVASYAAANNYSILVANPDGSLPASEAAFKGSKVYIVGGPTLVADIAGATRIFGADRFATNQAVLKALTYTYNDVYVANGTDAHLVDSLVASSLAAVSSAPIVLADTNGADAAADIHAKLAASAVVTALGGSSVVPDSVVTEITTGVTTNPTPPVNTSPVTISALAVTGQLVGTGVTSSPAVAVVNDGVTVSGTVNGASAANASITYLVSTSNNITAKDSNGNTLVATTLNSPVIVGNDTFSASYSVPADASGNVKAVFTSTASSQESFNVVVEAPFSNNGQPVMSEEASIEWGVPGTTVLSPIYSASNPDSLNFSTSSKMKGLVPVVATILPATGATTSLSGQPVKFTMTMGTQDPMKDANAFFTDTTGTTMVASGASVGKGGSQNSITYVANTDTNGQALVYINSNLPTTNGLANPGGFMNVSVNAQLVNGGGSTNTGYYQWKAVAQATKIGNVSPAAMLNPTGISADNTIASTNAETATSGSQMVISGTLQDSAGNPVSGALVAIQDYDVINGASNNVSNDAFVTNGTTTLFSAVNYPTVTTDSNGNWSVTVTANVPVTQSVLDSVTQYYAYYVPSTIAITTGQSLPNTVTPLNFVGNQNTGNFINLVWQQGQTAQSIGVSHTSLMPNYATLSAVPQTASFTNVVGSNEQMYAAAYNQNGTIIAPAAGNQFDSYALIYDLLAPSGINFQYLGSNSGTPLPVDATHGGIGEIKAQYFQDPSVGFKINELIYVDGTVCYSDGTYTSAVAGPTGFDPTVFGSAYDGSGQLNFYLNSNKTTAVVTSGTAGSVNVNISVYSNSAKTLDPNHAQGSAAGTINASFTASNSIGTLGVVANLAGFSQYIPLLDGNAAPGSTLTVAGVAIPAANAYDASRNATFIAAPFNSYPALSTVPSQGLTMNMSSTLNGVISNVDGYTLASMPNNVTVNVNGAGEVSANNVKLWMAQSTNYKVVGFLPGATSGSFTLIEENLTNLTQFIGVQVASVGTAGTQIDSWTVPEGSLPLNYEEFLGFNVNASGQLQPMVASYYDANNTFAPYVDGASGTVPAGVFSPVEAAQVSSSDKYSESPVITVSNSLNSKTATVTENFTAATGGLVAAKATPSSVNSVVGGTQNITITAQDAYGNPIANQTIYVGTGIPGLWITQVNGTAITSSVNMGTTSSTSMQTVSTPIPLYKAAITPAYDSAAITGVTAYHLQSAPVVALTTGVDGTVSITLVDGNVTYVANTATTSATNSYQVDPGQSIINQTLGFFSDNTMTLQLGSVQVNWGGGSTNPTVPVVGVTLNNPTLALTVGGATGALVATVTPSTATNPALTWSSSNTAVATVSTAGVVTAVAPGTATITATAQDGSGKNAVSTVTVTAAAPAVNAFTVAPKFNVFEIDGTLDVTKATVVKATGTEGTVTGVVNATTGVFTISTATFATEAVKVQAYDALGNAVGSPVTVVVM